MPANEPPVRFHERHDAIPLRGGRWYWIECTCGWVSGSFSAQRFSVEEHAHHVRSAKGGD
jgi:hypothetical protein